MKLMVGDERGGVMIRERVSDINICQNGLDALSLHLDFPLSIFDSDISIFDSDISIFDFHNFGLDFLHFNISIFDVNYCSYLFSLGLSLFNI